MKQTAFWRGKNLEYIPCSKYFSTYICWINIQNATLEVSGAVRPLNGSLGVKGLREVAGWLETSLKFRHVMWRDIAPVSGELLTKPVGSHACLLLRRNARFSKTMPCWHRFLTNARCYQGSGSFPKVPHQCVALIGWLLVCDLAEICRYLSWGRLKSGNACYHSVQNLLSSSLLSINLNCLTFWRRNYFF